MAEVNLVLDALNRAREKARDGIVRSSDLPLSDRERLLQAAGSLRSSAAITRSGERRHSKCFSRML